MAYPNTKITASVKIFIILTIYCISVINVYASSYSSNFSLNDEALDFANSSEYINGTNYSMDLSSIFWTSRIMESASYKIIDANSDLSLGVTPPGPGGGGGGGGGFIPPPAGEKDKVKLETLPIDELPELELHDAPDIIPTEEKPNEPEVPAEPIKPALADDRDGCSPRFENKFMKTNPYDYDSDNDGVGDCDEQLVYGLNPLNNDKTDDHTGLALFGDYIYTEERPFLVGRADFGNNTFETTKNLQMQLDQMDPLNTLGLFFIKPKKDLNFAQYTQIDLQNGRYQSRLYLDGVMQYAADYFKKDNTLLYTELRLDVPVDNNLSFEDRLITLTGTSGINYGVVAIWQSDDFVDVSAVLTDKDGNFKIYSPRSFNDGEYTVTLYGLIQDEDKIIQTNYQEINYKVEGDKATIMNKVYADIAPIDYAAANITNDFNNPSDLHSASTSNAIFPIMGLIAFSSFTLIGFYFLWKQKNI